MQYIFPIVSHPKHIIPKYYDGGTGGAPLVAAAPGLGVRAELGAGGKVRSASPTKSSTVGTLLESRGLDAERGLERERVPSSLLPLDIERALFSGLPLCCPLVAYSVSISPVSCSSSYCIYLSVIFSPGSGRISSNDLTSSFVPLPAGKIFCHQNAFGY
jgi:hypothetical protein